MKRVEVDLSDSVYARLREMTLARGESVTSFLTTLAYREARALQHDEVAILWAQGFTDRQIAYELGWTNIRVANRRRAYNLPANRPQSRRPLRVVTASEKESRG